LVPCPLFLSIRIIDIKIVSLKFKENAQVKESWPLMPFCGVGGHYPEPAARKILGRRRRRMEGAWDLTSKMRTSKPF
jgi:hypothetical protein